MTPEPFPPHPHPTAKTTATGGSGFQSAPAPQHQRARYQNGPAIDLQPAWREPEGSQPGASAGVSQAILRCATPSVGAWPGLLADPND